MKSEFRSLVKDTLSLLKEEEPLPSSPKKIVAPNLKPEPKPKEVVVLPPQPVAVKQETPSLFEKIQKHLPHIRLVQKIPSMQQVAIIVTEERDLPFLKNLARAIQERLCPVKLLRQATDEFTLILTREKIPGFSEDKQILLEKVDVYQNNTEQKKLLWSQICRHLSPKSS